MVKIRSFLFSMIQYNCIDYSSTLLGIVPEGGLHFIIINIY